MREGMKIVYEPLNTKTNKYCEIISDGLAKHGITCLSLKETMTNWSNFKSVKVFHLNWYENLNGHSANLRRKDYFKRLFLLVFLGIWSKKIVWTMHNRRPHEKSLLLLKRSLIKNLVKRSARVVIHSKESAQVLREEYGVLEQKKLAYIPHPSYVDLYGPSAPKVFRGKDNEPLRLFFVGAIKPYKNIELLIMAANSLKSENLRLNIFGQIHVDGYEEKLRALIAGNQNIQLHPEFATDEQILGYLERHDALICPYDMESSLNSGTVILAFSYRTTVICPNIGTISDFGGDPNILSYDYEGTDNHLEALTAVIRKAIQLKKSDPDAFIRMGEHMYQRILRDYSGEKVVAQFANLYKSIV